MFEGKKILAVIPARGGSKGLPGKNIKDLAGKPLIAWTIEACEKSKWLDRFVLSSDDSAIIEVAKKFGCEVPFVRPSELAQDGTPGIEPLIHAVENLSGYDFVVLLQPTSPLRSALDIDTAIELCIREGATSCISLKPAKPSSWYVGLEANQTLVRENQDLAKSRQNAEGHYLMNGAIYVLNIDNLLKTREILQPDTLGMVMSEENSVDIDTLVDFKFAESLILAE